MEKHPVQILTISAKLSEKDTDCKKYGSGFKNESSDKCESKNHKNVLWFKWLRQEPRAISLKNEETKKSFTINQKIVLIMLATADFMSSCLMSIMAPFYPSEAARRGVSESMSGLIFGFYAIVVFLSSPIFGKIMLKVGLNKLFIMGLFICGVGSTLFGMLILVNDYHLFVFLSFIIRGLEALGATAYSTAGYVIIINIFPDHASTVRGILETFVGLGLSAGPGIGGLLFSIGGFGLPFYVVGGIMTTMAVLNLILLPPSEKCEVEKGGSLLRLLKLSPVIMACLIILVVAMTWGYLDPTLEPHLRKFNLSPGKIGLVFLLLSAMYGICCPIWGCLVDKIQNYWWLMTTGLFLNSIVLLFLGPSPVMGFFLPDSLHLNIIALSVLGITVAMSLMPTYQFIVDTTVQYEFPETLGTHSVIAGLWTAAYSLGEVVGPILGGTLMEHYGFAVTSTTFAIINVLLGFVGTVYFLRRKKPKKRSTVLPINEDLDAASYKQHITEFSNISIISRNVFIKPDCYRIKKV